MLHDPSTKSDPHSRRQKVKNRGKVGEEEEEMSKKGRKLKLSNSQGDNFTHGKRRGMNKSIRKGMPDGRGVAIRKTIERISVKTATLAKKQSKKKGAAAGSQLSHGAKTSIIPFSATDVILLVGEGNFSFAASISTLLGNAELLTATSYDSEEEVKRKYPDSAGHISTIQDLGGSVLFGIDGTKMDTIKPLAHLRGLVTRLVFNFPHAGAGIKDQDHNIISNQRLLAGFFNASKGMLSQGSQGEVFTPMGPMVLPVGQALVTLKSGLPYDEWGIVELAGTAGLGVQSCTPFKPELYPGYEHRRTIGAIAAAEGNVEFVEKQPKMYAFFCKKAALAAAAHRKTLLKRSKKSARMDRSSLMRKDAVKKANHAERTNDDEDSDDDE